MSFMNILQAAVLGVVQGLTEYLPISSTAHLRIIPALLGWSDPGAAYTAVIQLGTLASVLIYYRRELGALLAGAGREAMDHNWRGANFSLGLAICVGTLPIGVLGLLFKDAVETNLRGLSVIATSLIALAVVLAIAEKVSKRTRVATSLTFWEIQLIGAAQAMALIPGASRSGTTLTAALLLGLRREEAANFSFLLGIPAIAAAGLFELKHLAGAGIDGTQAVSLIVGTLAALISGWLAIAGLLKFLKSNSTMVFIVYRIILGVAIFAMLASGWVSG